ncbi:DVU_1557 family redox protein [Desulfohalovibrio reitneri]|uniref:DVU_1557 family redox protein n=1 Tax=Desulfohalovibrio reitneri TaxID=1307759 RepID=UPI0004A77CE3|nr:CLJU_RS11820 family redox protein [Desulfohalovibrio reitneri]
MKVNQDFRPESGEWRCATCGTPLEPGQVELRYLGNSFTVGVLVCGRCGHALITEDMACGKMLEVEQLLEDK